MQIIEYKKEHEEGVKDLLIELQKYIASLDKEHFNVLTDEFRNKYFDKTFDEINKCEGKAFVCVDKGVVVGLGVCLINNEATNTYDFVAPKRGRITELVVKENYRGKGIGSRLLVSLENYLKKQGCEGVLISAFGYNTDAIKMYEAKGYIARNIEMFRKL